LFQILPAASRGISNPSFGGTSECSILVINVTFPRVNKNAEIIEVKLYGRI
jgi:hypothetical protein